MIDLISLDIDHYSVNSLIFLWQSLSAVTASFTGCNKLNLSSYDNIDMSQYESRSQYRKEKNLNHWNSYMPSKKCILLITFGWYNSDNCVLYIFSISLLFLIIDRYRCNMTSLSHNLRVRIPISSGPILRYVKYCLLF